MRSFISTHQRTSKKRRRMQGLAVCPPTGHDSNEEDSSNREDDRETLLGRQGWGEATHTDYPASMATGDEEAGSREREDHDGESGRLARPFWQARIATAMD